MSGKEAGTGDTVIIQLMQGRRGNHRSTERVLEERHTNARVSYERKCLTPSVLHQQKKSSTWATNAESKTKEGSTDKRYHQHSKQLKPEGLQLPQPKQHSPFRHKSNPPLRQTDQTRHCNNSGTPSTYSTTSPTCMTPQCLTYCSTTRLPTTIPNTTPSRSLKPNDS